MQKQIASYLYQHKTCPLPGLGTLSVLNAGAEADFVNKLIAAPRPFIQYINVETNPEGLYAYITSSTNLSRQEATEAVKNFCAELKNKMAAEAGTELEHIGNLYLDANGKINFRQEELPAGFLQPVLSERVIHPQAEHQILVGDRETTNTMMTEFFTEKPEEKNRWWIWAIVLGAIGLLLLLIYFTASNGAYPFGSAIKI